jgi:hypothetical protein
MPAEFSLGTLSSTPVVASNFVGNNDTRDTFSLGLGSSGSINLALTGLSADADVRLFRDFNGNGIVDSGDTQVGSSTRGGDLDDSINIANQAAGNYVVQVDRFDTNQTKYDLRLSTTPNPPSGSPSNLLPTETAVGAVTSSRTFSGQQVGNTDISDTFNFAVNSARNFRFTLDPVGNVDADLRLIQDRNSNLVVDAGEVIATSTLGSGSNDVITSFLQPGDNYFVQVYQYSGNPIDYSLNITPV